MGALVTDYDGMRNLAVSNNPGLNEANTTPTCCCTQKTEAPAKHSLDSIVETATLVECSFDNIAEPCEELPPTPNLSLPADVELEVVDLSDDPNIP